MNFISKFLASYDYSSIQDFLYSLFPSFKYHLEKLMLLISFVSGIFDYFFGIGPGLAVAMFIAVFVEILSGIKASKCQGKDFESFRFSRCIIKIAVWLTILYIIHQFELEFIGREGFLNALTYIFAQFCFVTVLTGFLVEYIVSIMENKAVINGKPKTELVMYIKDAWTTFINLLKLKNLK